MVAADFDGSAVPTGRTTVLLRLLAMAADMTEEAPFSAFFNKAVADLGGVEERVGYTIYSAIFMLEGAGLIRLSTRGSIQKGTTIVPNKILTDFIWDETPTGTEPA